MAKLYWDRTGERLYETGVSHGVLYLTDGASGGGAYTRAYPWNGLISVSESPSGAEANPFYADNIKYLNLVSNEEFACTIGAYTYPKQFAECDGSVEPIPGVSLGQQTRKSFGFSYRTRIGNDVTGDSFGYKIHIVYNGLAAPSEKEYATVNESPEPIEFSWEVTTTPIPAGDGYRPLSTITIDSTEVSKDALSTIENILYGTDSTQARLPQPEELLQILSGEEPSPIQVEATAPTFDDSTGLVSVPTVIGVTYTAYDEFDDPKTDYDGTGSYTVDPGTTVVFKAVANTGYELTNAGNASWTFTRD